MTDKAEITAETLTRTDAPDAPNALPENGSKVAHGGRAAWIRSRRSIYLEVSIFAGTPIEHACRDLVELANKLNITTEASFNGVTLMAQPSGDPNVLQENWSRELQSKHSHKIASCHPR